MYFNRYSYWFLNQCGKIRLTVINKGTFWNNALGPVLDIDCSYQQLANYAV